MGLGGRQADLALRVVASVPGGNGRHQRQKFRQRTKRNRLAGHIRDGCRAALDRGRRGAFRFIVDGQYVDRNSTVITGGGNKWAHLGFGSRKWREIVVEGTQGAAFIGVNVGPTEQVRAPQLGDALTGLVIGDSYTDGTGIPSDTGNNNDGLFRVMGDFLGIADIRMSGNAGSGWAQPGSGNLTNIDRLPSDIGPNGLNPKADIIFVALGLNDGAYPAATVTASAKALLTALRAYHPTAPIVVFGAWPGSSGPSATIIATETAAFAAIDQLGDPLITKIPVSTLAQPPITGTGTVAAPNGTGNSGIYIGSLDGTDGTHPYEALGHAHLGMWAANRVMTAYEGLR